MPTTLLFTAPLFGVPSFVDLPALLVLVPVLYVAGATPFLVALDIRHRRLPNIIVLPGVAVVALAAVAAALWAEVDVSGTALAAGGALFVFVVFRVAGAIASGDVKLAVLLAAALAPLAGAGLSLYALAGTTAALTAGLASLLVLVRARPTCNGFAHPRRNDRATQTMNAEPDATARPPDIPLGPFLLLGFWVAVAVAIVRL